MLKITRTLNYMLADILLNGEKTTVYLGVKDNVERELVKMYGTEADVEVLSTRVVYDKKLKVSVNAFVAAALKEM